MQAYHNPIADSYRLTEIWTVGWKYACNKFTPRSKWLPDSKDWHFLRKWNLRKFSYVRFLINRTFKIAESVLNIEKEEKYSINIISRIDAL